MTTKSSGTGQGPAIAVPCPMCGMAVPTGVTHSHKADLPPVLRRIEIDEKFFEDIVNAAVGPGYRANVHWGEPSSEGIFSPSIFKVGSYDQDKAPDPVRVAGRPVAISRSSLGAALHATKLKSDPLLHQDNIGYGIGTCNCADIAQTLLDFIKLMAEREASGG